MFNCNINMVAGDFKMAVWLCCIQAPEDIFCFCLNVKRPAQ